MPLDRIAIVGASVSAGFGGTPFGDAFTAAGHAAVESEADLMLNTTIIAWAHGREHVLMVPLAAWIDPLRANGMIELSTGEKVEASSLMAADGLHANAMGTWYLLDKLDRLIEATFPGTPKAALVFVRPAA